MIGRIQPGRPTPWRSAACAALLAGAVGCGGGAGADVDAYENLQLREPLVEASMGRFSIPIPIITPDESGRVARSNRLQLRFALHGLVTPEQEATMLRMVEEHDGQLRDRVIRVCRNASVDDLLDPQLSTLKSRLLDATQPLLEGVVVKKILITDVISEPL